MNEHELTKGRNPFLGDKDGLWTARDEQSSEDELGEFLYGLIRFLKPSFVVETGAYLGDATLTISKALKENDYGRLVACEIEGDRVEEVNEKLRKEGLFGIGQVLGMKGIDLIKQCGGIVDFAFIDSGNAKVRIEEIEELSKHIKPRGIICLHDTAPQHAEMHELAKLVGLPQIYLNTPRGLTIYQKL